MYFGSNMDCTRCHFGYMHPYLLYTRENFTYFYLMVWIHMYVHEYIFLSKFEYFMYFFVVQFFSRFFLILVWFQPVSSFRGPPVQ
jgi:hypothetical protein